MSQALTTCICCREITTTTTAITTTTTRQILSQDYRDDELERFWKKVVMDYLKAQFQHLVEVPRKITNTSVKITVFAYTKFHIRVTNYHNSQNEGRMTVTLFILSATKIIFKTGYPQ
jgi:hypothetical protein